MPPSVLSALACTLFFSLVACGGDDASKNGANSDGYGDGTQPVNIDTAELEHTSGGQSWTVLVYMVADNNLEPFALLDIEEMINVGSNDNFHLVLELDRAPGYTDDGIAGIANFENTKRFLVKKGSLQELDDLGEINTGDPTNLANFVTWGAKAYPSDKLGIILWDHGSAWPGFGADETSDFDGLTLTELAGGFSTGLGDANLSSFNLIGFDACLMGSLETALALRPFGEYLVGSEELEPGHGWDYTAFAKSAAMPSVNATDLGKQIIDGYKSQANSDDWQDGSNITLALVDLYNLKAIERSLRDLQSAYKDDDSTKIARVRQTTLEFGVQPNPQDSAGMIDLSSFATGLVAEVSALVTPASALVNNVKAAVVYSVAGSALATAKGLSVYWPAYASYYNTDYDKLSQMTYWRKFLDSVQAATSSVTKVEFIRPQDVVVQAVQSSYLFAGQLTASSAPSAVAAGLYYGYTDYDSGTKFILGDTSGLVQDDIAGALWDFTVLTMTQGSSIAPVYYSFAVNSDGGATASIPF
ncbi:MAG: hypothetical protein H7Z43_04200, partial [Clostridia bacterium]|nr:hypothetical protein [Deltaproteobacteria bacterium]